MTRFGSMFFVVFLTTAAGAQAQSSAGADPNSGALSFTGGLDVPSVYVFRGIVQEVEPRITAWPYGDLGITLVSGGGRLKSMMVNVGVWNSIQTGSSGTNGPSRHAHYEEDFYTTLTLGLGGGIGVGASYRALTSPNQMWDTIKEIQIKVTASRFLHVNPYGVLAMELTTAGHIDAGSRKGTYFESGIGPAFPLGGRVTVSIPVKVGLSLRNYYESKGADHRVGFFDVGGLVTFPLSRAPGRFGSWNLHGGADLIVFGDGIRALNIDASGNPATKKVVALVGLGLTY